jgi:hypothetical protein
VGQVVGSHEADAGPGRHEPAVGELIVGAQRELLTGDGLPQCRKAAHQQVVVVVSDEAVLQQLIRDARRAGACQVALVRRRHDGDVAQLSGNQRALLGPHHAHGDVGLAPQQVGQDVGGHQFDLDARLLHLQGGDHRRQQPAGGDLAGGDADGARGGVALAGQHAAELVGAVVHLAGCIGDGQCRRRGGHATAGAFEQRHAELGLELGHVAAQGGLVGLK